MPSDWSEPYLIPLVLDSAECNTQVSSGPERIVDDSSTSNDGKTVYTIDIYMTGNEPFHLQDLKG